MFFKKSDGVLQRMIPLFGNLRSGVLLNQTSSSAKSDKNRGRFLTFTLPPFFKTRLKTSSMSFFVSDRFQPAGQRLVNQPLIPPAGQCRVNFKRARNAIHGLLVQ